MAAAPAAACRKLRREVRPKTLRGDSVLSCDIEVLLLWQWNTAVDEQQMIRGIEQKGKARAYQDGGWPLPKFKRPPEPEPREPDAGPAQSGQSSHIFYEFVARK
jgi:hypothetical protein